MKRKSLVILAVAASMLLLATISMAQCPHSAKTADATTTVPAKAEGNKVILSVSNMTCGACVSQVTKALTDVEGVKDVTVSLEKGTAEVVCDAGKVKADMLAQTVTKAGYPAKLAVATDTEATATATKASAKCASTCGSAKKKCDPTACGMKTAAKSEGGDK